MEDNFITAARAAIGGAARLTDQDAAWICQVGPGLLPTSTSVVGVAPFISQIEAWPFVFCHRMSEPPSPLKSLVLVNGGGGVEIRAVMSEGVSPLERPQQPATRSFQLTFRP
jgi:hypothetical protein